MPKPRQILDAYGHKAQPPNDLQPLARDLAAYARAARKQRLAEQRLGRKLAPVLRSLTKRRDKGALADCGNFLASHCTLFDARFFFEAGAQMRSTP